MAEARGGGTRIEIGRINIGGVSAATARAVGPAIRRSLAQAATTGELKPGRHRTLRITLPKGASATDVAAAVTRALRLGR